jgi:hypothetical protein
MSSQITVYLLVNKSAPDCGTQYLSVNGAVLDFKKAKWNTCTCWGHTTKGVLYNCLKTENTWKRYFRVLEEAIFALTSTEDADNND